MNEIRVKADYVVGDTAALEEMFACYEKAKQKAEKAAREIPQIIEAEAEAKFEAITEQFAPYIHFMFDHFDMFRVSGVQFYVSYVSRCSHFGGTFYFTPSVEYNRKHITVWYGSKRFELYDDKGNLNFCGVDGVITHWNETNAVEKLSNAIQEVIRKNMCEEMQKEKELLDTKKYMEE